MTKYRTIQSAAALPVREPPVLPVHEERCVIVVGGAGALGQSVAELLLGQGAQVFVIDLEPPAVDASVEALGGVPARCFGAAYDLADEASVEPAVAAAADAMGGLDGLVNCAALVTHADPLAIPRSDWRRQFEVNLFGAYDMARTAARRMIDDGETGAIVNIASEAGKKGISTPWPTAPARQRSSTSPGLCPRRWARTT